MQGKAYFMIGDIVANAGIGALAGLAAWGMVSPGWNMWLAMLAAMLLGMVLGMVLSLPVGIKLGAMEVMVPLMFSGMQAGMVVGMVSAMMPVHAAEAALYGVAAGMLGLAFVWIAHLTLRGPSREAQEG